MNFKIKSKDGSISSVLYDPEDLPLIKEHHWYANKKGNTRYVLAMEKGKAVYLHRIVMYAPPELTVDHINGNGLDNRKENLRCVPLWVNLHNGRLRSKRATITSQYKGVCWRENRKRWRSYIYSKGKCIELGLCKTEEEAHRRQVKAETELLRTATGRLSSGEKQE
jgi:hypothetical protein